MRKVAEKTAKGARAVIERSVEVLPPLPALPVSVLAKQVRFDDALGRALDQANAFLAMPIPDDDPAFIRKWSIKASLIATILSTGVKIDENELKRVRTDGYEELMRKVEEVQARRARPDLSPDPPTGE